MFKHNHEDNMDPTALDRYQQTADQVTEATEYLENTQRDLMYEGTHPWHAPDALLLHMGYAAIAYANDRSAELLRQEGVVKESKKLLVARDCGEFALELSQNAAELMNGIRQFMPSQETVVFDEETIANLNPENMVPYWPRTSEVDPAEDWQGDDKAIVTKQFLTAIIAAARDMQVQAATTTQRLADPTKTNASVPVEYASLPEVISELINQADVDLQAAEVQVFTADPVPGSLLPTVYAHTHSGYIGMMNALIASVCPPVLGEDFLPNRL